MCKAPQPPQPPFGPLLRPHGKRPPWTMPAWELTPGWQWQHSFSEGHLSNSHLSTPLAVSGSALKDRTPAILKLGMIPTSRLAFWPGLQRPVPSFISRPLLSGRQRISMSSPFCTSFTVGMSLAYLLLYNTDTAGHSHVGAVLKSGAALPHSDVDLSLHLLLPCPALPCPFSPSQGKVSGWRWICTLAWSCSSCEAA